MSVTKIYETEILDKLYLEWSQFTLAMTEKEARLLRQRDNLSTLVRRMAKALQNNGVATTLIEQATDYLRRENLEGQILREEQT